MENRTNRYPDKQAYFDREHRNRVDLTATAFAA